MKKFIILFLLTIVPTQLGAYFIRGSIYKNNETGQFLLFLGDLHTNNNLSASQFKDLVTALKKTTPNNLILVEDSKDKEPYANEKQYQEYISFADSIFENMIRNIKESISPLKKIKSMLKDENISSKNIECRFKELRFVDSLYTDLSKIKIKKIGIEEVLNEQKNNIENTIKIFQELSKIEKLSKKNYKSIKDFIYKVLTKKNQSFELLTEFVENLKKDSNIESESTLGKIKKLFYENVLTSSAGIVDANIINEIIKNNDKKLIVICCGHTHISRIEALVKTIGYELISEIGSKTINPDPMIDNHTLATEITKIFQSSSPISVKAIFNILQEEIYQEEIYKELKITKICRKTFEILTKNNIVLEKNDLEKENNKFLNNDAIDEETRTKAYVKAYIEAFKEVNTLEKS